MKIEKFNIESRKKLIYILLFLLPLLMIFFSLFIGRYPLNFTQIIKIIGSKFIESENVISDIGETVVFEIRLPRAILGALVGGGLAISGAALQGLFHNPLVDSGILGVSAGAGFGAALAIIYFDNIIMIYILSFLCGLLAVFLSYTIASIYDKLPSIMLVLGGVIVSSVFKALVSFFKYVADPQEELPEIVFWLMGSLASANYNDILIALIPISIGAAGLLALRWRINVLSMGDKEARAMGIKTDLIKMIIIVCTTIATTGAVCVSGTIGWIGLVIPHIGRMIVGNDNRILIPSSFSLGAFFLILIDNVGRVITGSELPLSIITALVGGPFYVYLLKKTKGGGW